MKTLGFVNMFVLGLTALTLIHCGQSQTAKSSKANFHLLLTDAPATDISSVIVNVKHAELRITGSGREARVLVAEGLGPVDLLKLRDGVTLPMASIQIPPGTSVTQIRLVLEDDGHYIVRSNERVCHLRTPSARRTGIKMIIHQGIAIDAGYDYSVVADFDAEKSIVLLGNGGCLLKPVLKLKSATQVAEDAPADSDVISMPVTGDNLDTPDGFDEPTPEDETVPVVDLEQLNEYML